MSGNAGWEEAEARLGASDRLWLTDEGPAVALAAGIGRRHPGVRIGVLVDPHRRPLTVMAKHLTGLDVLIGGRLDVALPAGDDAAEAAVTAEAAEVLRALGSGRPFDHEGHLARADGARNLPPSPQAGRLPIFRVVGRGADWLAAEPM